LTYVRQPRKRNHQKLSTAAQIRQTSDGCIDLETPNSILVNTDLRVCTLESPKGGHLAEGRMSVTKD